MRYIVCSAQKCIRFSIKEVITNYNSSVCFLRFQLVKRTIMFTFDYVYYFHSSDFEITVRLQCIKYLFHNEVESYYQVVVHVSVRTTFNANGIHAGGSFFAIFRIATIISEGCFVLEIVKYTKNVI